jgi:Ca2+-transporting ATPase
MKFAEERSRSAIIHVSPFNSEKKRAGVAVAVVISTSYVPMLFARAPVFEQ